MTTQTPNRTLIIVIGCVITVSIIAGALVAVFYEGEDKTVILTSFVVAVGPIITGLYTLKVASDTRQSSSENSKAITGIIESVADSNSKIDVSDAKISDVHALVNSQRLALEKTVQDQRLLVDDLKKQIIELKSIDRKSKPGSKQP